LRDQGAQLINYGGDFFAFMKMLEGSAADLNAVYGDAS
jgi:hypothetical protein